MVYYLKTIATPELNYKIYNKELLVIIKVFKEWQAKLKGLQRSNKFSIYINYKILEYFIIIKKLNG